MEKVKTALILAGGDSTRFWPLVNKNMMPFFGKPFAQHIIKEIIPRVHHIIIVSHPCSAQDFQKISVRNSTHDCKISVAIQHKTEDGMAGAVTAAKEYLDGEVVIVNANDLLNFSILEKIGDIRNHGAKIILVAKRMNDYFPGGYLKVEGKSVTGIVEKPSPDEKPSDLVKLVVDYFSDGKRLVDAIQSVRADSDDWYEKALDQLITNNASTKYIDYDSYWYTIKYPWQVLNVMEHFLSKISGQYRGSDVSVSNKSKIEGDVYVEDNVRIGDYVKIVGPCYIGRDTKIGDYAMIRSSHVGENAIVGGACEVARSYIGSGVMLHRNYVGDSVIGKNVLFGAGAITANFRFDEGTVSSMVNEKKIDTGRNKLGAIIGEGAKIGVHSTLAPGVKIGSHTYVGPHTLVSEDISDGMFYYKEEMKENKNRS